MKGDKGPFQQAEPETRRQECLQGVKKIRAECQRNERTAAPRSAFALTRTSVPRAVTRQFTSASHALTAHSHTEAGKHRWPGFKTAESHRSLLQDMLVQIITLCNA